MTVELVISLSLLFIVIVFVLYKTYLYIKAREVETQSTDLLTNLLPFIKSNGRERIFLNLST